jgi:hypothetical protein
LQRAFEELVVERSGGDFVERDWLTDRIDSAVTSPGVSLVLISGEPGTGKTSLLAGLARSHPTWLRYFIGGENAGAPAAGDIGSFLLSVGHQLAAQCPTLFEPSALEVTVGQRIGAVEAEGRATGIRIDDLTVSPFYRTARLTVQQHVERLSGTVTGVEIGTANLEPRLLEPDNLAHLALLGPAGVLADEDPDGPGIVILLDALDEAARAERDTELLTWLATGPHLPGNVTIVITSRPQSALGLLRSARDGSLLEIVVEGRDSRVAGDLLAYAEKTLATDEVTSAAQARGLFPDQFRRQAARRAEGNFLYLVSYVRALNDAIASDEAALADRLFRLEDVPPTLAGIYGLFVELARVEIDRLGLLDIENPLSPEDQYTPSWEGVGQPILGVLTVAREPLTEAQLMRLTEARVWGRSVLNVLARLRWLLRRHNGRVALFHASVGEFLTGPIAREKHTDCWLDQVEWHERITRHYRGPAATWAEVDWSQIDRYGLTYLPDHVLGAKLPTRAQAVDLICGSFLQAVRAEFGVERPFLGAVDQIARYIAQTGGVEHGLSPILYLSVVRNQAVRWSKSVPARAFGLMARVGRLNEALERAAELTPSFHQFAAFAEIAQYAECGPGEPTRQELNERVVECALMIPPGNRDAGWPDGEEALGYAARLLASYDMERALRLWERAQEEERRRGRKGDTPPDDVYRRAADAEQDVVRARALTGKIRHARCDAYLKLTSRDIDPAQTRAILEDAERSLAEAEPLARIRSLSQLVRAWHGLDEVTLARLLAELRSEVFEAGDVRDLGRTLIAAARTVAPADASTARMLLARFDFEPDATDGDLAEVAHLRTGASGRSTSDDTLESVEQTLATLQNAGARPGTTDGQLRTLRLVPVVSRFARHDLARAAEVAREAPETAWYWGGYTPLPWLAAKNDEASRTNEIYANDRYSMLAGIAHLHLNRGELSEAIAILEETLAFYAENSRQFGAVEHDRSEYLHTQGVAADQREGRDATRKGFTHNELFGMTAAFNAGEQWRMFVRGHFFRGPADVVRAASTAPGSLARTLRVAAEQLRTGDLETSTRIVRALEDAGERAIGLSALHQAAHDPSHGPKAEELSRELDRTLAILPAHRWTSPQWATSERHALAYARPDIRVRFEVALKALDCRERDTAAIEEAEYLKSALGLNMYTFMIDYFIKDFFEREHFPRDLRRFLTQALGPDWFQGQQGDPLIDCTRAALAFREFQIIRELPGYAPIESRVRIEDPIYATAMELVAPTDNGLPGPAFAGGIRRVLADGHTAAAAGLLAFAAEIRPELRDLLLSLGKETIAAADEREGADRIDALAYLAGAPILGDLVDPVALFEDTKRKEFEIYGKQELVDAAAARLYPALLRSSPSAAMQALYDAATVRWSYAMVLIESAIEDLQAVFGSELAVCLATPLERGLACVAADGSAPEVANGVSFRRLLSDYPMGERR